MFNLNEAVKHDFKDLSKEDQDYILKTFLRYIVRSEVADNNKVLSSIILNDRQVFFHRIEIHMLGEADYPRTRFFCSQTVFFHCRRSVYRKFRMNVHIRK